MPHKSLSAQAVAVQPNVTTLTDGGDKSPQVESLFVSEPVEPGDGAGAESPVIIEPTLGDANANTNEVAADTGDEFLVDDPMPPDILEDLIFGLFDDNLLYINGQFYGYRDVYWVPLHELAEVKKPVAEYFDNCLSASKVNDIINRLKIQYAMAEFPEPMPNLICVNNGVVDQLTGELHLPAPEFYLRNRINIKWEAEATCPNWQKFLNDLFREDQDKAQKIQLLQQWFGYCLTPSMEMQQLMMFVGQGENGKSVVMDVLAALIGPENTSHTMIEDLLSKEFLAALDGKLLNISAEVPESAWRKASILKAYVSGDKIQARLLYKNPVTIKPTAKLMVSSNNLPKIYDHTHGFFRRVMILTFNRKFTGADRDRHIKDKLLAELPGILVWALSGLQQLKQQKDFVVPVSSEAAKQRYQIESDDAQLFREECLETDSAGAGILTSDMYLSYCEWAKASGLTAMNKYAFGKRLAKAGVEQRHTRHGDVWLVRAKDTPATNVIALVQPQPEEQEAA